MHVMFTFPAAFFTPEALETLPGQTAEFTVGGATVGQVTVVDAKQSTLGPELTCRLEGVSLPFPLPPQMLAAADVSLHRSDRPGGSGSFDEAVLRRVVYPADRACDPTA